MGPVGRCAPHCADGPPVRTPMAEWHDQHRADGPFLSAGGPGGVVGPEDCPEITTGLGMEARFGFGKTWPGNSPPKTRILVPDLD